MTREDWIYNYFERELNILKNGIELNIQQQEVALEREKTNLKHINSLIADAKNAIHEA